MGRERRWGEEKRRELMAAFRRSGVSLRAFAERAGVPYSTMVYWRQRGEPTASPTFVPVEVAPTGGPIEVVVGSAVVRVEPGFDEAHLARVVRSLRAC
jgi:transposase-like protein